MKFIDYDSTLWKTLNSESRFFKVLAWAIFSLVQPMLFKAGNPNTSLWKDGYEQWAHMGNVELYVKWLVASAVCLFVSAVSAFTLSIILYQLVRSVKSLEHELKLQPGSK